MNSMKTFNKFNLKTDVENTGFEEMSDWGKSNPVTWKRGLFSDSRDNWRNTQTRESDSRFTSISHRCYHWIQQEKRNCTQYSYHRQGSCKQWNQNIAIQPSKSKPNWSWEYSHFNGMIAEEHDIDSGKVLKINGIKGEV